MENLKLNQQKYEAILKVAENLQGESFEQIQVRIKRGAELVKRHGGFHNIEYSVTDPDQYNDLVAYTEFRVAKRLLGEYIEEINT